jgi:hypothetical protein
VVPRVYELNNRTNITFTNNIQRENTQQTVSFTDRAAAALSTVNNPLESTFMLADTSDRVESFFERPQVIFTEEWSPGVTFHQTIDPWSLFFENPRVMEKLTNFYLLRAQLHIKIVVNSSPFYYGRLMASYNPMAFIDSYTFFRPGTQADFIQASQRPSVVINPASDEVAEMILPYVYPRSALVIPEQEWKNMGTLTIADLNMLQNANAVADPITITVFAWATNVSYSQPTSVPIPVQGELEDTHPSGVISAPASSLARYASMLGDVPLIGKYAKATSLMGNAVSGVASLFGYSKPRQTAPHISAVLDTNRRFTNYNNTDLCETLALDQKQEVTIDPRVTGCDGGDQMALVPLAKRESYLHTFTWDTSMPPQTLLFNSPVTPLLYGVDGDQVFFTPMGWVSLPFRYWRGSLKFRFEVVASKFHRGRLRVMYDPAYQATNEYNTNYTKIIDVADGADFTMQVGWGQGMPYLPVPYSDLHIAPFSGDAITSRIGGANGIISMFVVNSLTTPNDAVSNVQINVYVSACDDFEVHAPNAGNLEGLIVNQNPTNPIAPIEPPGTSPPGFDSEYGSYVHYVQPLYDHLAPDLYGYNGILLGCVDDDPNFTGSTTVTFGNTLRRETTPYDITARLVCLSGAPPSVNVILDGVTFEAVFRATYNGFKEATITYTVPPNTVNATLTFESTDGLPWTWPLAIVDVKGRFSFASTTLRMQDIPTTPNVGSPTYHSDVNYNWWDIPPGASVSCVPPAGLLNALVVSSTGGTTVSVATTSNSMSVGVTSMTVPRQIFGGSSSVTVTSGVVITNTGSTNNLQLYSIGMKSIPNQGELIDETEVVAGDSKEKPVLGDIFFGESVVSIRQILKRYTISHFIPPLPAGIHWKKAFPNLPVSFAKTQLERVEVSLWKWFVPAFLGWKGSVRMRLSGYTISSYLTVTRLPLGADNYLSVSKPANDGQTNVINWNGSTVGFTNQTPLAAELPWYSNKRFLPARAAAGNSYFEPEMAYQVDVFIASATGSPMYVCNATGEDFSTYMFLCTPIVSPSP